MANEAVLRAAQKVRALVERRHPDDWHTWFAWRPILTLDDHRVWLRWVEWTPIDIEFDGDHLRVYVYRLA